ncbi:class I SAM-dependent methyltransferase [Domibacillus indicus]|uniref:class I SAM-dependent methyltransferase n=1 Tax=Domibacillus indicus TaxID=1437523 RepID=UPI000617D84C|nr:class I SAM-dependent methyltransferase [Domibacillus indicus]
MKESAEAAKQKVKKQFGQSAEQYVTSSTHSTGTDLSLLQEWLQLAPDSVVLDIATGGGHAAKALAPYTARIYATDLTVEMLEAARKHLDQYADNVFYMAADAEALPFLSDTFDAVTCRIAAHHFPNPDLFVKEAARVLKPGGRFILIDNISPEDKLLDTFVNQLESLRDPSHVRSYAVSEWKEWLNKSNLNIVNEQVRRKILGYPEWVRRTASSAEQIQKVDAHLHSADQAAASHFSIQIHNGSIHSFELDEWMVMAEKKER